MVKEASAFGNHLRGSQTGETFSAIALRQVMIYGSDGLESRIADLTGRKVDRLLPVQGGYTNACRRIVNFRDGNTAFAKCATDRRTSGWLRSEISIYRQLSGDFIPAVLAWDEEEPPLLILEDLSGNLWPPP